MKNLIEIFKNYKYAKKTFWIFLLALIITQIIWLSEPYLIWKMLFVLESKWSLNDLYLAIFMIFIVNIIMAISYASENNYERYLNTELYNKLSQKYKKILLSMDFKHIINNWTWKIISKINSWTKSEVNIIVAIIKIIIISFLRWLVVFIILSIYVPKLVAIFSIILFLFVFLSIWWSKKINKFQEESDENEEYIAKSLSKIVMEFILIKINNKKRHELELTKELHKKQYKLDKKIIFLSNLIFNLLYLSFHIFAIIVYIYLWTKVLKWEITFSEFSVISLYYAFRLRYPVENLTQNTNSIIENMPTYLRLKAFIDLPNNIQNWKEVFELKSGEIKFKNTKFWYNESRSIFDNFDIKFDWWKTTALVWHSWSWKSTLIKLILRIYDINDWDIFVDWQKISDLDISTFYQHIWYLSQEPAVFDWTIKENLLYAFDNEEIDDERLWEALRQTELFDLIYWFEKWINTEIWEKGLKLSWWEKQRLAIARIFLKNPKILILDEPTSSLDSISESKITKIISKIMKWKTVIVIAHRLQTVMNADKIIVMEKWKIIETWTHSELLNLWWTYNSLVDLQRWVINE